MKIKIFVSAYACEPWKGSEIGVGWHWVLEMSKYFELWVMTRKNNKQVIEKYFSENKGVGENIHWVYYDCPDYIKKLKKGMRGVRTYYTLWQYGSSKVIKKTMEENNIEVFHLLTYGNALWHIPYCGQKKFFIWGPTGGLDTIPKEYSKHYSFRNRFIEFIRRIVVKLLRFNIGFQRRCKNANLILCKSEYALNSIKKKYQKKAIIFTDVASDLNIKRENTKKEKDKVEYLVVGKLDAWRGFDLLINAFYLARKKNENIHLTIMGKGSDKKRLKKLIEVLNLGSYVDMVGELDIEGYYERVSKCDVIINPSLKEGAVTVSFDAISYGKPFICVDTKGYTKYFKKEYSIILERKKNRKELIYDLEKAILKLTDFEERKKLSENIIKQAESVSWSVKGREIRDVIEKAYYKYKLTD